MPAGRMPHSQRREALARATAGGLLLQAGPAKSRHKLTNPETGRVYPCCWTDCENEADFTIKVEVPHQTPSWRDEATGKQEMVVFTFCSAFHRQLYLADTELRGRE